MKTLLENWNNYLKESRILLSEKQAGDWTVAELLELINLARKEEGGQADSWLKKISGKEIVKLIPYIGNAVTAGEMLYNYHNKLLRKPEGPDLASDFPVLDALNMDPNLIKTVEDDILNKIDEQYQQYLQELDPDTKIRDIIKINDFIRLQISKDTNQHVVIRDESN